MTASTEEKPGFVVTGKHVLLWMIMFFSVIIVVNVIMVNFAVRSFPGEQQKKSYMQGLNYNEVLAERAEEAALGWRVVMPGEMAYDPNGTVIELTMEDASGLALRGLSLEGVLGRPVNDSLDRTVTFTELGDGRYQLDAGPLGEGIWDLQVVASRGDGRALRFEKRLWLK